MENKNDWIKLLVKYKGKCVICSKPILSGDYAYWSRSQKAIMHIDCKSDQYKFQSSSRRDSNSIKPQKMNCSICNNSILDDLNGFDYINFNLCYSCLRNPSSFKKYKEKFLIKLKDLKIKI